MNGIGIRVIRARKPLPRCTYSSDGVPDSNGEQRCRYCGLPQKHERHDMPAVDTTIRDRMLGER